MYRWMSIYLCVRVGCVYVMRVRDAQDGGTNNIVKCEEVERSGIGWCGVLWFSRVGINKLNLIG